MKSKDVALLKLNELDADYVIQLIQSGFKKPDENITPLKVLSKMGIPMGDQTNQLKFKSHRIKIKKLLIQLAHSGFLEAQLGKHSSMAFKEDAYKVVLGTNGSI